MMDSTYDEYTDDAKNTNKKYNKEIESEEEPSFVEEELEEEEVEEEEELIAGTEKPIPIEPPKYPVCRLPVIYVLIIHIFMTFVDTEINAITDYLKQREYSYSRTRKIYELYMITGGVFCLFQAILADCYFSRLKTLIYGYIPRAISLIMFFCWFYMKFNVPAMYIAVIMASTSAGALSSIIISIGLNQFEYPEQCWSARNFIYIYMIHRSMVTAMSTFFSPHILLKIIPNRLQNREGYIFFILFDFLIIGAIIVICVRKKVPDKQLDVGRFLTYGTMIVRAIKLNRELDEDIPGHFLDIAKPQYGDHLVDSLKQILVLLVVSIPLFIFWSFYYAEVNVVQQEYNLNSYDYKTFLGEIGVEYFPPLKLLIMVGNVLVYKFLITNILKALDIKMNFVKEILAGMFILVLRYFVYHHLVDATTDAFKPDVPKNGSFSIRLYNPTECALNIEAFSVNFVHFDIEPMGFSEFKHLPYYRNILKAYKVITTCDNFKLEGKMDFKEQQTTGGAFFRTGNIRFFQDIAAHTTKLEAAVKIIVVLKNAAAKTEFRLVGQYNFARVIPNFSVEPLMLRPGSYSINDFKFTVTYNEATVILIYAGDTVEYKDIKISLKNRVTLYRVLPDVIFEGWGEFLYTIGSFQFYYFNGPSGLKTISLACHYMFTRGLSHLSAHIMYLYMFRDANYWRSNYLDQIICVLVMIISMYLFPSIIFKFRNSWKWIKTWESTAQQ